MNIGNKEIAWELLPHEQFRELLQRAVGSDVLEKYGVIFPTIDFGLNVSYDNPGFELLLREKFGLCLPYGDAPNLTFIPNYGRLWFELPYKHYGYVSDTMDEALVFASSFGIFKSTISGYASFCMEGRGYIPAHASVLSAKGKGLLLTGGSDAGKTTTLLNLVYWLLKSGESVSVLTDDWTIVAEKDGRYFAESLDPSVSLQQKNLDENQHLRFSCHTDIQRTITAQKKVSRNPEELYGCPIGTGQVILDTVILLLPQEGDGRLHSVDSGEFAKTVVDAAYHYPYISVCQRRRHEAFWVELSHKLPVFSFSTRGHGEPSLSIDALKELIHGT